MKKVLLLCAFICTSFFASAQTEKGSWLVGVNSSLGFNSVSFDGDVDKRNSFNINGSSGYFLMDNLSAGLGFGYASTKQGSAKNSSFSIGPFVRYYLKENIILGASFSTSSLKSNDGQDEIKTNFSTLGFEAGYAIWLVDNIAIEPRLHYGINSGDDGINNSTLGLHLGFSIYL